MSERAGLTNKGKDGKTKYSSLNLYDTYKGDTSKPQRPTVSHGRGLQSLGKVGSSRRVPPPAVLPSLRSESGGNDPNVNLVPEGGAGWKAKDKRDTSSPPIHATAVSHQVAAARPVQIPGGLTTIQPSDVQQSSQQTLSEPVDAKSWGSVVCKDGKKGIKGYKPQDFQEEFPSLGTKELMAQQLQKTDQQQEKPSATNTEQQYGPGPSLRPQNVGSWKDGGGSLNKPGASDSDSKSVECQEKEVPSMSVRQMSINGGAQLSQGPHPPQLRPRGMMPQYVYGRFPTSGPGTNYPGNFHPMPSQPPSAFNNYPDKRMPAPNRGSAPSRRDDTQRPAIISEKTLMQLDNLENDLDDSGWAGAPKEVDYGEKLVFSDDEGHVSSKAKLERKTEAEASMRNEEDSRTTQEREQLKSGREIDERPQPPQPTRQAWSQPKESSSMLKPTVSPAMNQPQPVVRAPLSIHPSRQAIPIGPQMWHSQRMQTSNNYEARAPTGLFAPPNRFVHPHVAGGHHRMPTSLQSGHPQTTAQHSAVISSDDEHNLETTSVQLSHLPPSKSVQQQPPTSPPPSSVSSVPQASLQPVHLSSQSQMQALDEEDVAWHQQRHKQSEKMTNAIERARQRREDDSKSEEERKAAAQEKLRLLEEKIARRKVEPVKSSDEDTAPKGIDPVKRQRTESESSDSSRQGTRSGNSGYTAGGYSSRSTAKNLPPRFQKQEMMRQQEQQLQSTANRNLKQPILHAQIDQRSQRTGPPPIPAFVADSRVIQGPPDRSFNSRRRQDSQGSDRQSREDDDSVPCAQPTYQRRISGDRETPDENKRSLRNVKDMLERGRTAFPQTKIEDGVECVSDRMPSRGENRREHWKVENDIKKTEEPYIDMEKRENPLINSVNDHKIETKQIVQQPIAKPISDQIYSQGDDAMPSCDKQEEGRHSYVKKSGRYTSQRDDVRYGQKDQRRYVEPKENTRHGQPKDSRFANQKEGKRNEQKDSGRQTDGKYGRRYSNSREFGRNSDPKSRYSESQHELVENKFVQKPWQLEHAETIDPVTNIELKNLSSEMINPEKLETPSHKIFQNEKPRGNEKVEIDDSLGGHHVDKPRRREPQRRKPKELVDSSKRKDRSNEKGSSFTPVLKSFTVNKEKNELPEKRTDRNSVPTSAWTKPLIAVAPTMEVMTSVNESLVHTNVDPKEDQKTLQAAEQAESKTCFKDGAGDEYKGRSYRDRGQRRENDKRKENYRGDERKVFDGRRVKRDFYPARGHSKELGNKGRGRFDPSNKGHGRSFAPSTKSRGRGDRGKRSTRDGSHFHSNVGTKRTDESAPEMYSELETKENVRKVQDTTASAAEHITVSNINKRMDQRDKQSNLDDEDNHQPNEEGKFRDQRVSSHHDSRRNEGRRFDDSKASRRTDVPRRGRGGSNRGRGRPVRFSSNSTRTYSNEHYDDSQYSKRSDKSNVYKGDDDNKRINHGKRYDRRSVSKDDDEPRKSSRYDRRTMEHRRRQKPERPPRFQKNAGKARGKDNETVAKPVEPIASCEEIATEIVVKPPLSQQNSSDQNNEDWETASESSEFSEKNKKDKENQEVAINVELVDTVEAKDSIPVKKSFLNQRPGNEKATRRSNTEFRGDNRSSYRRDQKVSRGSGHSNRSEPRRGGSNFSKSNKRNGVKSANQHNSDNGVVRQQQNVLYRLDDITLNSPQGVTNALTDATAKVSVTKKAQDSKPRTFADKKRDVLADFDLNNYAGVVIIDNNPEVIVEDPNDLMTPDEGFQEVMSKQTRKKKAQQEEERKKQETSFTEAVIKKPKLGTNMKIRHGQGKAIKPKEINGKPELSKSTPVNAANLDSVQATSIPTNSFQGSTSLASKTTQVNAWSKPLAVTLTPGMRNNVAADVVVKGETEQHDSGIELNSDQQASAPSSQTSSPTGDVKGDSTSGDLLEHVNDKIRQQKSKETGIGGNSNNYNMDSNIKAAQPLQDHVKFSTSYDPVMPSKNKDSVDTSSIFSNEKQLGSKFQEENRGDSSGRNQLDHFEEHVRTKQSHHTASRNIVQSHDNSKTRIIGQSTSVVSSQSQVGKQQKNALPTTELPHSISLAQAQVALAREPIEMPKSSDSDVCGSKADNAMKHKEACDNKPLQIPRTMHRELQINTQSPNSPATDELTKSIKSTKKLWESRQSLAQAALSPGNGSITAQTQAVSATPTVQISSSADFNEFQRRQHVGEGMALGSQSQSGVTFGSFGNEGDLGDSTDITNQETHTSSVSASSRETFVSFNGPTLTGQHQSGNSYMVATGYAGLSAFSTAANNLPFPSVVLTNTMETKPIGGNIPKVPAVGFNPSMMISNSAQHTQYGSVMRPGNASPSVLAQGLGSQVAAFQRGDTARMMGSGVTLTGPSIASVIQHQPSTNYQYGIGHTIAPSPPAQQSFAPVGFITSQQQQQQQQNPLQQANLGILSQPLPSSSLPSQTFLGFSSLGFSQGVENPSNASLIGKPSQTGPSNKTVSSLQFNNVPNVNIQPTQLYAQRPTTPVANQQNLIGSTLIPAIQRNIQQAQQQSSFFATNSPVGSMQASNTYFSSLQAPPNSQPTVQALPLQLAPTNQYQYHSQTPSNIHQSTTNMNMPTTTIFGNLTPAQNSFSRAMAQLPVSSTASNIFSAPVDKKLEFLANHSMITPHTSERNLSQRFSERPGMPGRMIIEQNRSNIAISDLQQHVDAKPFNPVKRNEMPFQHNMGCPPNRVAMKSPFCNVPSSSSFITPSNSDSTLQQMHQPDIPMRYISASTNNAALHKGIQNKNIFPMPCNPNTSIVNTPPTTISSKQQVPNHSQAVQLVVQHHNAKDGRPSRGITASAVSRFPNPVISHKALPFGSPVGTMFPVPNAGNVNTFHQQPGQTVGNVVTRQTNPVSASVTGQIPNQNRKVVNGKMTNNYSTRPLASKPYEKLSGDALKVKQDKEKAALLASTRAFFHEMNQQTKSSAPGKDGADSKCPQPKGN